MTTTPRLGITQLEEDQALPEVVVNEADLILEGFATRAILKSKDDTSPPGSPAAGDMYLVGASATGAWASQDGKIAQYRNGAWAFFTAKEGFEIEVEDEDTSYTLRGGTWSAGLNGLTVEDEGVSEGTGIRTLNFTGAGVSVSVTGTEAEITVGGGGSGVDVEDEGVSEATGATILNFTGAGVTATDAGGGQVDISIPGGGGTHRGALVTKAANQTTANYTTATAIAWDSESYDTDTIHDNVTNNTRLSVPSGVTKVRLAGQVDVSAFTANTWVALVVRKNGSAAYTGAAVQISEINATFADVSVCSPVLLVTGGTDYFELFLQTAADTSITVAAQTSWFAMDIIE